MSVYNLEFPQKPRKKEGLWLRENSRAEAGRTDAIKGMGRTGETYIGNGKEVRGRRGIKE